MFTLVNLESATLLSERFTLEDGRRAARAARLLSRKTGQRFQPRKIESVAVDTSWHDREIQRFNTGEYIELVNELNIAAHVFETKTNSKLFAHISKKNPALIAYTKDAQKGAQDKQSLLSIESFVKMVCVADDETQAYLTLLQMNHAKAHMPQPFKLATTPDEIEKVYTNYASDSRAVSVSCMHYGASNYSRVDGAPFHPVRVYGAGDLAIAYLTDSAGKTTARALCWPEHKIYSRMYADNDALHNALKEAGYSKSSYYGPYKSLNGARLLLVENDHGNYIAPYLDEIGAARINDDNLIIDEVGDYTCQSTSGTAEQKQEGECCDHCGDSYDADDMSTIYTDSRQHGGETWCRHCRESDAFYCEGTQEYYSDNVDSGIVDEQTYTQRYIDNNAHYCEYYEEYTFDDLVTVIVDTGGETQEWSDNAVSDHAYKYDGDYYSNDLESVKVVTERYVLQRNNVSWDHVNYRYVSSNFWYVDVAEEIPVYLIDDESVDVIYNEATEFHYLKNYVDHYPVARERFDVVDEIVEAMIADVLAA